MGDHAADKIEVADESPLVNGEAEADLPVLIVGAGPCGLAIAHGLQKHNIPVLVFDKDPCLEPEGRRTWAMVAAWSAPILKSLVPDETWAQIKTALTDPTMSVDLATEIQSRHGATGEVMGSFAFAGCYRFYRPRLRSLLGRGVDLSFGKQLDGISYDAPGSVTAHFADGTAATGRLLIGADGARSRTRHLLLGPERTALTQLPYFATFVYSRFPRAQALYLRTAWNPLLNSFVHPNGKGAALLAVDTPDPARPEDWVFMAYISEKRSPLTDDIYAAMDRRDFLDRVRLVARTFCDPVRAFFEWLPEGLETVYFTPLAEWDPRKEEHVWDGQGGRVTLAGDAAHPMSFQRAQGLNHAIDDAGRLVEALTKAGGGTQAERVAAYEAEMRPRAGQEVDLSRLNTEMLHDWSRFTQSPLLSKGLAKTPAQNTAEPKGGAESSPQADTEVDKAEVASAVEPESKAVVEPQKEPEPNGEVTPSKPETGSEILAETAPAVTAESVTAVTVESGPEVPVGSGPEAPVKPSSEALVEPGPEAPGESSSGVPVEPSSEVTTDPKTAAVAEVEPELSSVVQPATAVEAAG